MLYDMCHVMLCYITKYVMLRHLNCISFQCVMLRYNISHAMLYNMLYNICHVMLYDMCHVMLCYITKYVMLRHLNCISFQCVMLRYNISHAMLYNMLYNICHVMLYDMCHLKLCYIT